MGVTVYSLPNCVQCDRTKKYLDQEGIAYNAIDLAENESARTMVREMGYTSAPVVVTPTEHWSGFRLEKLKAIRA